MANYDGTGPLGPPFVSKTGLGLNLPTGQVDSGFGRMEPLLTAKQLVSRHLKGIPLVSRFVNPFTHRPDVWTPEDIEEEIRRAINNLETLLGLDLMPVQHAEKHDFNRQDYESFGYLRTRHKPVSSVEEFAIVPANNIQVYEVPLDWIETAYLSWGQIAIVPLNVAVQNGGYIPSQSAGGAVFLSILAQNNNIPAYWRIVYTTGFPNGVFPVVINELVGIQGALQILEKLLATYVNTTSHSVGIDGISQSVGAPQVKLLGDRITQLAAERDAIARKLRRMFGQGIVVGAI